MRPLKPCRHPGCKNLSVTGYCEKHSAEGKPWAKKNEVKRLRGRKGQARRKRIAERDGFVCQICGAVVAKGIADHKTPLAFGGLDTEDNLQWICTLCHQKKSVEEKKGMVSKY